MKFLKDLRVVLAIILVIVLIAFVLTVVFLNKGKTTAIAAKDEEIAGLQSQLSAIGDMSTVYVLANDVTVGKEVTENDFTTVDIPAQAAGNVLTSLDGIVSEDRSIVKYFKIDMPAGTIVTKEDMLDRVLQNDERLFDVVTDSNPVGLEVGSYVDVRIQLPTGADYIAIPHKRVEQLNSGTLKLILNEEEIHAYNSMLIDWILYGANIYAVQYVEGGLQATAETYYPISQTVVSIAAKDPNLLTAIKQDMLVRRAALDGDLDALGMTLTDKDIENLNKTIEKGRENIRSAISEAQKQVDKEKAEYEKQKAKEAEANN